MVMTIFRQSYACVCTFALCDMVMADFRYKNGREIKPDSRVKPKKVGDKKFQLAIIRAEDEDDADYKVG